MGTLLHGGYPAGKGMVKDSYPLHLVGKSIIEIDGYANGRVNALPLPYPAHCHPYSQLMTEGFRNNRRYKSRFMTRNALFASLVDVFLVVLEDHSVDTIWGLACYGLDVSVELCFVRIF
jgi:hypothetical protein